MITQSGRVAANAAGSKTFFNYVFRGDSLPDLPPFYVRVNPLFVSDGTPGSFMNGGSLGDYHLQSASPALNYGNTDPLYMGLDVFDADMDGAEGLDGSGDALFD